MKQKICLITGGSSGIGKASAKALVETGIEVSIVGRDASKNSAVIEEIKKKTETNSIGAIQADLSKQKSIRELVENFRRNYDHLDILINNAGVFRASRELTYDGIEMTFAVNHLAPFLLTNLLLEELKANAPSRVITVSSVAHRRAKIDFDNLQGELQYSGIRAYSQSKLANLLFTYELARKLKGTGVTSNCLHPGAVSTNLVNTGSGIYGLVWKIMKPFMLSPEKGAETCVYLATSLEVEAITGKYFVKKRPVSSSKESYDEIAARRLWEISANLTGLDEHERKQTS